AVSRHLNPAGNRPGEATARGVLAGMRAARRHLDATHDLAGQTVRVQGMGSVGAALSACLTDAGAIIHFEETDSDRAQDVARRFAAATPATKDQPADVFAPCASGPVIGTELDSPRARIVCGSANDQLAQESDAQRLHDQGVLWIPDFSVNAGAVIEGVLTVLHGADTDRVDLALAAIEDRVFAVLERSRHERRSPFDVARELAQE
ncbi:MAG: hypothetical protein KDB53_20795, partial [Planctomycetes bacterium]|nr:hypothetical protein [Planctomycetota bacterium]